MKYLLPVWVLLIMLSALYAVQTEQEAEIIAFAIANEIQTDQPILLDLRCGDWTSALSDKLNRLLLARGADLRIYSTSGNADENDSGVFRLSEIGLQQALLVQVNLNVKWQEVVQRKFFSYHSERRPIFSFETQQIQLPESRVLKVSTYDFQRSNASETEVSRLRLRWFEPLVASVAIGSMIFLLWNFD